MLVQMVTMLDDDVDDGEGGGGAGVASLVGKLAR